MMITAMICLSPIWLPVSIAVDQLSKQTNRIDCNKQDDPNMRHDPNMYVKATAVCLAPDGNWTAMNNKQNKEKEKKHCWEYLP